MLNAAELVRDLQEMRDEGFLSDALLRHAVKTIAGSDERFNWARGFPSARRRGRSLAP